MILMLLLTELVRLDVQMTAEQGNVQVDAPAGALSEYLRQAIVAQKAAVLQYATFPYVETIDGQGALTGNTQERDLFLVAEERQEVLRYRIGVVSLHDGVERFYYPRMVLVARPETILCHGTSDEGNLATYGGPSPLLMKPEQCT